MRTDPEVFYRFENHADVVLLEKYTVTRRTPCGAWLDVYSKPKFVLNDSHKRFAWPTEEEAKVSFFARKKRQLALLRSQAQAVEGAVEALKEGRIADYSGSAFQLDY